MVDSYYNSPTSRSVSGYNKAYTYDTRLAYLTPPYFLNPMLPPGAS